MKDRTALQDALAAARDNEQRLRSEVSAVRESVSMYVRVCVLNLYIFIFI